MAPVVVVGALLIAVLGGGVLPRTMPKPLPVTPALASWNIGPPAATINSSGQASVFWEGSDGNLYEAQGPANGTLGSPINLGMGPMGSAPAAATDSSGNAYVYWKGSDGNLWEAYSSGSRWLGPYNRGFGPLGSQPAVVVTASATAYVFWEGTNGDLYEVQGPANSSLSQLTDHGMGPLGSAPAVGIDATGATYVYWEGGSGSNYALWEGFWNGAGWVGPYNRGMAPLGSQPTVATTGGATSFVFWKGGSSSDLYEAQGPANGTLSGPTDRGMGALGSAPSAAVDTGGSTYVYWQGTNGDLFEAYWNGSSWVGQIDRTQDPPTAPTAVSATGADARAIVRWTAPTSPTAISKYAVTPFIGSAAQSSLAVTVTGTNAAGVLTSTAVAGLTDGTSYTFAVTATNAYATGPAGISPAVVPTPPFQLHSAPAVVTTPSVSYDAGAVPSDIALAQLNGNQFNDIVTANSSAGSISTLINQVKGGVLGGTFAQPAVISNGAGSPSHIAVGDIDGDGHLDVVLVNNTGSVQVMLGNGDGTFQAPRVVASLSNQNASLVALGDLNGNGRLDIIVGANVTQYPNGTAFDVLMNTGGGNFAAPVQYSIGDVCLGCGYNAAGLSLADLNGDGRPDVVFVDDNTSGGSDVGSVKWILNNGDGTFPVATQQNPYPSYSINAPGNPGATQSVAVADLNGDGRPDIVVMDRNQNGQAGVEILAGTATGFAAPSFFPDANIGGGSDVALALADMNGDGLTDIVTADQLSGGNGGISVYLNRGDGTVNAPVLIPVSGFEPREVAVGQLSGSVGDTTNHPGADIALTNFQSGPGNVRVLRNGTDFPPLGGPLTPGEMHGCFMCQALRGGGTIAYSGDPITLNSGEFSQTFTDVSIPARGYPLAVTQTYNDLNAGTDAGLGYGWWSPLFMSVAANASTGVTSVTQEDGALAQFWSSSLQPLAPRTQANLTHNGDGTWAFVRNNSDTFKFNSAGHITSASDLTGDSLTFGYTGGQVTSVTHSDGRSLAIAWSSGHISSITDSNVTSPAAVTRTVSLTYNGSNELTDIDWRVNGANDRNEHFQYDETTWVHGLASMRDPRGIVVTQTYDSSGHTLSQTVDPSGLNRSTTYTYTLTAGTVSQVKVVDPVGNQQLYVFAYGELVQKTLGYGTGAAATTSYAYDRASAGATTTIDADGNASLAAYDSYGNPLASADALGRARSFTYSGNGGADARFNQPTTSTDGNSVTTTYAYDSTHRTLSQISTPLVGSNPAVNQVIQYQHTNSSHPGDVTAMVDGDGKTWSYGYDAYGDRTSTSDPLGDKASSTFNADGWTLTTISPKGDPTVCTSPCTPAQFTTTYSYADGSGNINFWGLPTVVTDPLGHATTRVYDPDNNVIQFTDGNGNTTTYDFDNANELTVTHRADAGHTTVKTDYTADGAIQDQIDGNGNTIQSYTYNSLGQQVTVTVDPGSSPHINQVTTYAYDGVGNVLSKQDPGGSCSGTISHCTTYSYDAANQLSGITYSDGDTPNVSGLRYDGNGRRVAMSDGSGNWTSTYDSLGRLTSVVEGNNGTVGYQYNLRDEVTKITYPGSIGSVTRGYDNAGRWTTVQDWNGAQTTFAYDPNSNLQTETLPTTGTAVVDTFSFNNADQMTGISDVQGTTSLFTATYSRDGNGQVTSDSSAISGQGSYQYSPLNQVCYAGSSNTGACASPPGGAQQFAYDAADNLTTMGSTTQTFNAADELTASGASTYQYDTRGNRTSWSSGSSTTRYGYTQANQLCWAGSTSSGASCNGNVQTSDTLYCYNGDGLRMAKVTSGSCAAPAAKEGFAWDLSGSLPTLLVDGSTDYVFGPGGLALEQIAGSSTSWYEHDQIGSMRIVLNSSGAVSGSYTFDPYGNILSSTGSLSNQPFLFTGEYRDTETGLYYLQARYYEPATGQFLSRDPLVAQTRSPYGYAVGNPLSTIDPAGLGGEQGDLNQLGPVGDEPGVNLAALPPEPFPGEVQINEVVDTREAVGQGRIQAAETEEEGAQAAAYFDATAAETCAEASAQASVRESTGRIDASNLREQLAMEQAVANPAAGRQLPLEMSDPEWPASDGWVKMAQNINGIEIHYVYNTSTGAVADFKFAGAGQ
ncbi:MAG: VCBS repeat-containing protein [Candidatus Dormibacteraeota bacterium]|nr:VCBS repeat-containing protein [Candidatus Dormibacteraeota bacterium]